MIMQKISTLFLYSFRNFPIDLKVKLIVIMQIFYWPVFLVFNKF